MKIEIHKKTGTYADTLLAVGTASLLAELNGGEARIVEDGPLYRVEGEEPKRGTSLSPGFPFIHIPKDGPRPKGWVLDYEAEKARNEAYWKFVKENKKQKRSLDQALAEAGDAAPQPADTEYRMAVFLASMRKGWASDKTLYRWVSEEPEKAKESALLILAADFDAETCPVSSSQVFNPTAGKGIHRPKPDSTAPTALSRKLVSGAEEWMKIRGAFACMVPARSSGDFKVSVIEPGDIGVSGLRKLRNELLGMNLWGAVTLDVHTAFRLLEKLVGNSDVMDGSIPLRKKTPAQVVRGFHQAYFKSLGTAAALMNNAFFPLPSWFALEHRQDGEDLLEIVHEHVGTGRRGEGTGCLGSLKEDDSGHMAVLLAVRDWVASGRIEDLLEFRARFAVHVMERLGSNDWVRCFSTALLDRLLERTYGRFEMKDIVGNQGFLSVARAIRNATVYTLMKNRKGPKRATRFGLAQKWKQKIKAGREAFTAELCGFVQDYNWETEHKLGGKAHAVRKEHLDELIGLIEERGEELVGMLLIAYGYSRAPRVGGKAGETDPVETGPDADDPDAEGDVEYKTFDE